MSSSPVTAVGMAKYTHGTGQVRLITVYWSHTFTGQREGQQRSAGPHRAALGNRVNNLFPEEVDFAVSKSWGDLWLRQENVVGLFEQFQGLTGSRNPWLRD